MDNFINKIDLWTILYMIKKRKNSKYACVQLVKKKIDILWNL